MVAEADSAAECAIYCAREEVTFLSDIFSGNRDVRNFLRTGFVAMLRLEPRRPASGSSAISKKLHGRDCALDCHGRGISW